MNPENLTPEQMAALAKQQCIFCQIASGKVASKKVYEDEHVVAVLDINPANPGHILLITKEHYVVMPQIPDDIVAHIGMVTKGLSHALLRALKAQGTTIFVANGVTAGQRAQHFMLHIIPRMEGDGVEIDYPEHDISEEDYTKIQDALRAGVAKALGQMEGLEQETAAEEERIDEAEEKVSEKKEEKKEEKTEEPEKKAEEEDKEESEITEEEPDESAEEEDKEEAENTEEPEEESLEAMATKPKKKAKKKAKKAKKKKKEKLEPEIPNSRNEVLREPEEEIDEERQKLDDVSKLLMG